MVCFQYGAKGQKGQKGHGKNCVNNDNIVKNDNGNIATSNR